MHQRNPFDAEYPRGVLVCPLRHKVTSLDLTTRPKKAYRRPRLVDFGDVRGVTLGGSFGNFESGFPNTFFTPGGPEPPPGGPRPPREGGS